MVYFVPFGALFGDLRGYLVYFVPFRGFIWGPPGILGILRSFSRLHLGTSGDTWYTSFLLGLCLGTSFWGFIWGPPGILGILRSFSRLYLQTSANTWYTLFLLGGDTWYTSFLLGLHLRTSGEYLVLRSFWGFIGVLRKYLVYSVPFGASFANLTGYSRYASFLLGLSFGDLRGYLVYSVPFGASYFVPFGASFANLTGYFRYTSFLLGLHLVTSGDTFGILRSFWGFIW